MAGAEVKTRAIESRFDFTGGLNAIATMDGLSNNELLQSTNARVLPGGAVQRRAGIQKTHTSALGAGGPVLGLYYWEPAGVKQYVAIANGKLYYSSNLDTWTEVTPGAGALSTTMVSDFAEFRGSGGSQLLFIASGGQVFTWTGAAITLRSGTNSVPAASCVRVYGLRVFYNDTANPKRLVWSKIGDGTDCTIGGLADGGFADVDITTGDQVIALETIGSSLMIATSDSIARFTGTADDIQIEQDSQGIVSGLGPTTDPVTTDIAACFRRVDQVIAMMTPRGPYAVNEGGVVSLAQKLPLAGMGSNDIQWPSTSARVFVVQNKVRDEIWFLYPSVTDNGLCKTALVYHAGMQCYSGPFQFSATIRCVASALAPVGGSMPIVLAGCQDGFVRVLDATPANAFIGGGSGLPVVSRDDGSADFTHTVRFAPFIFDSAGPMTTKVLRHVFLQTQWGDSDMTPPTVKVYPDGGSPVTATHVSTTGGVDTPMNLRYDLAVQGKRFVVEVSGQHVTLANGDMPKIIGAIVQGHILDRIS